MRHLYKVHAQEAAPVADRLWTLILSVLNRSSLPLGTCETSRVLLAGGQVFFLGYLPFSPHLIIDSAQNE